MIVTYTPAGEQFSGPSGHGPNKLADRQSVLAAKHDHGIHGSGAAVGIEGYAIRCYQTVPPNPFGSDHGILGNNDRFADGMTYAVHIPSGEDLKRRSGEAAFGQNIRTVHLHLSHGAGATVCVKGYGIAAFAAFFTITASVFALVNI